MNYLTIPTIPPRTLAKWICGKCGLGNKDNTPNCEHCAAKHT